MPEISRFLGIVIAMFYRDHTPPHFHARYGDYEITVEVESGIVNGTFPPRALAMSWNGTDCTRTRSGRIGNWPRPEKP